MHQQRRLRPAMQAGVAAETGIGGQGFRPGGSKTVPGEESGDHSRPSQPVSCATRRSSSSGVSVMYSAPFGAMAPSLSGHSTSIIPSSASSHPNSSTSSAPPSR